MKAVMELQPAGIYTGAQAIEATGIPKRTFYHYVKIGKIPSHYRFLDGKRVYKGKDLIEALTKTMPLVPQVWNEVKRGRPRKRVRV